MNRPPARAAAVTFALSLAVGGLAACSSSSSSSSSSVAAPASSAAPADSAGPADSAAPDAATYCDPLKAAYAVKPASGQVASDADLKAFADAMQPAADAATADGKVELAAFFTLIAQMNAAPDSLTADDTNKAFTELAKFAPIVQQECGVDMMQ